MRRDNQRPGGGHRWAGAVSRLMLLLMLFDVMLWLRSQLRRARVQRLHRRRQPGGGRHAAHLGRVLLTVIRQWLQSACITRNRTNHCITLASHCVLLAIISEQVVSSHLRALLRKIWLGDPPLLFFPSPPKPLPSHRRPFAKRKICFRCFTQRSHVSEREFQCISGEIKGPVSGAVKLHWFQNV